MIKQHKDRYTSLLLFAVSLLRRDSRPGRPLYIGHGSVIEINRKSSDQFRYVTAQMNEQSAGHLV